MTDALKRLQAVTAAGGEDAILKKYAKALKLVGFKIGASGDWRGKRYSQLESTPGRGAKTENIEQALKNAGIEFKSDHSTGAKSKPMTENGVKFEVHILNNSVVRFYWK